MALCHLWFTRRGFVFFQWHFLPAPGHVLSRVVSRSASGLDGGGGCSCGLWLVLLGGLVYCCCLRSGGWATSWMRVWGGAAAGMNGFPMRWCCRVLDAFVWVECGAVRCACVSAQGRVQTQSIFDRGDTNGLGVFEL